MKKFSDKYERSYDRAALRSAFVSLFRVVISARKKRSGGLTFQSLAKAIGSTKYEVSRWFNGDPNWTLNTIANLAHALDLELTIQARERSTGIVYTPAGIQASSSVAHQTETRTDGSTSTGVSPIIMFPRVPRPKAVTEKWSQSRVIRAPDTSAAPTISSEAA